MLNAEPSQLYQIWMDQVLHSELTHSQAVIDPVKGGKFSVWDGYITGKNKELEPGRTIVQKWRTTEFPEGAPDSTLEIHFEKTEHGTLMTLHHHHIPDGQSEDYKNGWEEYYLLPLKQKFS